MSPLPATGLSLLHTFIICVHLFQLRCIWNELTSFKIWHANQCFADKVFSESNAVEHVARAMALRSRRVGDV